jgi:hypothetical protein
MGETGVQVWRAGLAKGPMPIDALLEEFARETDADPKSQSRRTATLPDSSQSVRQSTVALRRAKGVV